MNEQNKSNQNHGETPKKSQGELVSSQPSAWKKLLSKRWVYPAAYVAAAAIILTLVWVYQDVSQKRLAHDPTNVTESAALPTTGKVDKETAAKEPKAQEVTATVQGMAWPVADANEVKVVKPFFDENGSVEDNQAAMVQYNDTFTPNVGVDLGREDDKVFDVKAALSGKVTRVELNPPLTGTVIEITHDNNVKTVYQSLSDVKVKEGDTVKQGDTIGTAGRNEIEKDLGNHVHFEVLENGTQVNPTPLLPKK